MTSASTGGVISTLPGGSVMPGGRSGTGAVVGVEPAGGTEIVVVVIEAGRVVLDALGLVVVVLEAGLVVLDALGLVVVVLEAGLVVVVLSEPGCVVVGAASVVVVVDGSTIGSGGTSTRSTRQPPFQMACPSLAQFMPG
jgi:hypothetical protein